MMDEDESNFINTRLLAEQSVLARRCAEQTYTQTSNIQPFAILFCFNSQLILEKVSVNVHILGKPVSGFLGGSLLSLIHPHSLQSMQASIESLKKLDQTARLYVSWSWDGAMPVLQHATEGFLFRSGDFFCLEALCPGAPKPDFTHYALKTQATDELARFTGDCAGFANLLTHHVRILTGFDRVFCLQFDAEDNGVVIGESRNEVYPSLRAHHFPASDIPTNLRKAYLQNRFRHLPDRDYQSVCLLDANGESEAVDLGLSLSRAVGATHLRYLDNMSVRASLSFSVIINGQLWGIVGAHLSVSRQVPLQVLLDVQGLVELFAGRLDIIIENLEQKTRQACLTELAVFARSFEEKSCDLTHWVRANLDAIKAWLRADFLIWIGQGKMNSDGLSLEEMTVLVALAREKTRHTSLFASSCLAKGRSTFEEIASKASGMLVLRLDTEHFLIWLRAERPQEKKWGGDPHLAVQIDATGQIGPRQSFSTWVEQVRYTSLEWVKADLKAAEELHRAFSGVRLKYLAGLEKKNILLQHEIEQKSEIEMMLRDNNRLLESLMAVACSELQGPLREVATHCQLLEGGAYALQLDEMGRGYLARLSEGARKMGHSIDAMLEYVSLTSGGDQSQSVSLHEIFLEVTQVLADAIGEVGAIVTSENLPQVFGQKKQLYQLIQTLIDRALRGRALERQLNIKVSACCQGEYWKIAVEDNGIGLTAAQQDKIFEIFQHRPSKDAIMGLALCRRIAELHGGRIWCESIPGQGSTFFFTLRADPHLQ